MARPPSTTPSTTGPSKKSIFAASFIGTSIEWYDYYIFGTAAALVFGSLFFPSFSPVAGTLAAFATFAVGFVARPLGAAVIGHFGDRIGRKSMLVLTLLLTGGATFLIGVLPTFAAIGIGAPILLVLLRLVQGFGVGGEWGGAVLIATEHASSRRRALYGSFAQFGVPVGVLTSNLAFLAVSGLSDEDFLSWGWRIPFLLSIALVVVGFIVRSRLTDAPEFERVKEQRKVSKVPVADLFREQPRVLTLASLASIAPPAVGYTVIVYMLTYGTTVVGFSRTTLLSLILLSTIVWIATIAAAAMAADRFGSKKVFTLGALTAVLWPLPMFALVNTGSIGLALFAFIVAAVVQGIMAGAQGGLSTEIFDVRIRYSGISIAYQLGGMIGGAITPIAATALFGAYRSSVPVALYVTALSLISFLAILGLRSSDIGHAAGPAASGQREGLAAGCRTRPDALGGAGEPALDGHTAAVDDERGAHRGGVSVRRVVVLSRERRRGGARARRRRRRRARPPRPPGLLPRAQPARRRGPRASRSRAGRAARPVRDLVGPAARARFPHDHLDGVRGAPPRPRVSRRSGAGHRPRRLVQRRDHRPAPAGAVARHRPGRGERGRRGLTARHARRRGP